MSEATEALFDNRQCPEAETHEATAVTTVGAVIVDGYVPPFAKPGHRPEVLITVGDWSLRYSKGPQTGTFWDTYGDDFQTVELARSELAKAPPVPHGKPYLTFSLPLSTPSEVGADV